MKTLLVLVLWCLLLALCWPLALVVVLLWPVVWLLSLPFVVLGVLLAGMLALLRAIVFLPARLLSPRAPG